MKSLSNIAILISKDSNLTFELEEVEAAFNRINVNIKLFTESDSIIAYKPDCVLITSPQDAKLTPFPTYGLLNKPRDTYLETPRFLRNILTYDGFFTFSPRLKQMLEDVMFGARKLGTSILDLDFFPAVTEFNNNAVDFNNTKVVIFEPDFNNSRFKTAILHLLDTVEKTIVVTNCMPVNHSRYAKKIIIAETAAEVTKIINQHRIVICFSSGDQQEQIICPAVIKAIAASAVTIAHRTDMLQTNFGDNLYYIPERTEFSALSQVINAYLAEIKADPMAAIEKAQRAHAIFLKTFAFDSLLAKFEQFHADTLINKGYVPHPDPAVEKALPSVSYIMRTGGKHRPFLERTLDCLVAQQYPDLRVIFVIHAPVPFMQEIIAQYPTIKFKVVESIKSRRSEAIRDGMAAVETELFGLFDDDDELFPNHVRMLVKALQYNNNRDWRGNVGMAYSGSLHVDDTYPVYERVEFHDHHLTHKEEKRAIEHFKFYSSVLMSQHAWFMPNGWLARKSIIDDELLVDPQLDTCEDLYFELQMAQKTHFAFSAEVTAVHNFHHLGNSTIDDSHKHLPDTQRIALRNFSRTFPADALYDTTYNIIGRHSTYDPNQIAYQDSYVVDQKVEYFKNAFYPQRQHAGVATNVVKAYRFNTSRFMVLGSKVLKYSLKFSKMDRYKRGYYIDKFKMHVQKHGFLAALRKMDYFISENKRTFYSSPIEPHRKPSVVDQYYKVKITTRYLGWKQYIKSLFSSKNTKKVEEDL